MGQPIQVAATRLGDVALFDTDRSISGQDGMGFASIAEAEAASEFPAKLAARLFDADSAVDHVFAASNQVVVRPPGRVVGRGRRCRPSRDRRLLPLLPRGGGLKLGPARLQGATVVVVVVPSSGGGSTH